MTNLLHLLKLFIFLIKFEYIYYINLTYNLNIKNICDQNYKEFINKFKTNNETSINLLNNNKINSPFKSNGQKREFHSYYLKNLHFLNKNNPFNGQKRENQILTNDSENKINNLNIFNNEIQNNIENLIKNKKISNEYLNTTIYKSINDIINRTDLNEKEMQFEIETFYINTISKKIEQIITKSNFF